jgi:hypothetical protein
MSGHTVTHGTASPTDVAVDKWRLVQAMAVRYGTESPEFQQLVRSKIASASSAADSQVLAWEAFCMSLPYRREAGELLANPLDSAKHGGDCDDLVLLFLAGCVSLGIPCEPEMVCTANGWPFHIRAKVGLPPLNPTHTYYVDPVCWSERDWSMGGRKPATEPGRTVAILPQPESRGAVWLLMLGVALGLSASKIKSLLGRS